MLRSRFIALIAVILSLVLLAAAAMPSALASGTVIDKTKEPNNAFAFPEGSVLLEVWFPHIYGCDSILVKLGEHTILVDAGKSDQYDAVRAMIVKSGVEQFDYILNTHPDPDHVGGFFTLINEYPVAEALTGFPDIVRDEERQEKILARLAEKNIPTRRVQDGETLEFGSAVMKLLQRYDAKNPRINNNSVMLHITFGSSTVFLTGDIQKITQTELIAEGSSIDIKADLLKFPHHGYDRMQAGFIDMVDPEMVVMTSNTNGTEKARAQMKDYDIPYYLTGEGVLRFTTDGQTWMIERID